MPAKHCPGPADCVADAGLVKPEVEELVASRERILPPPAARTRAPFIDFSIAALKFVLMLGIVVPFVLLLLLLTAIGLLVSST